MGSEGGGGSSSPWKLAKLIKLGRMLLMTSGGVAVLSGTMVTDTGSGLVMSLVNYGKRFVESTLSGEPPSRPKVAAAPRRGPDLRGAIYHWQAVDYHEGEQVLELGKHNMIFATPKGVGLTSSAATAAEARFRFEGLSSGSVSVRLRLPSWGGQRLTLLSAESELVSVVFQGSEVIFGDHREDYRTAGCAGEDDDVTIAVAGGQARLWCNGQFVGIQEVRRVPFSSVQVSGLMRKRDFLYSVISRVGPSYD